MRSYFPLRAYPMCGNKTIIYTQKSVFIHKRKKNIIVEPIHFSLHSESKN